MPKTRRRQTPPPNPALWLAAGAAAGVVAGVIIADRFRGARTLVHRLPGLLRIVSNWVSPDTAGDDDEYEEFDDDDEYAVDDAHVDFGAGEDEDDDGDMDDEDVDDAFDDEIDDESGDDELDEDDFDGEDGPRVDERVLAAFEQDPILSERAIEIDEPDSGTIVLRGPIGSAEDAAHAVIIARGVPGVATVENRLRVRRPSR